MYKQERKERKSSCHSVQEVAAELTQRIKQDFDSQERPTKDMEDKLKKVVEKVKENKKNTKKEKRDVTWIISHDLQGKSFGLVYDY